MPDTALAADAPKIANAVMSDFSREAISNPRPAWVLNNADKQVFYPSAFEGTWNVTGVLREVTFPQGKRFLRVEVPGVTKSSMIAALPDVGAGMEAPVAFQSRYVRGVDGVTADRVFNQRALLDAFLGYAATGTVEYDSATNPTRYTVVYSTPRRNAQEQSRDLRKAEIFINSRRYQAVQDDFYMSETYRQVNQAKNQGFVYDYETIVHYRTLSPGHLRADMRVAAFLLPSSAEWFASGGKSVAHYDYALDMQLVGSPAVKSTPPL